MANKLVFGALAITASVALAAPAAAAVEVQNYTFSAVTPGFGIENYSGSFVLSFDDTTSTYTLDAVSFNNGSIDFDLSTTGLDTTFQILIGGNVSGVAAVSQFTDDFSLQFNPAFLDQGIFAVSQAGVPSIGTAVGTAFGGTVIVSRIDSAVPEASTWAMMLLGFGAAGFAIRRRRQAERTNRQVV